MHVVVRLDDQSIHVTQPLKPLQGGDLVSIRLPCASEKVFLELYRYHVSSESAALCVHTHCWRIWTTGSRRSIEQWYEILCHSATSYEHVLVCPAIKLGSEGLDAVYCRYARRLAPSSFHFMLSLLPPELRRVIWSFLPDCMIRSWAVAVRRLDRLSLLDENTQFPWSHYVSNKDGLEYIPTHCSLQTAVEMQEPRSTRTIHFQLGPLGLTSITLDSHDRRSSWAIKQDFWFGEHWYGTLESDSPFETICLHGDVSASLHRIVADHNNFRYLCEAYQ